MRTLFSFLLGLILSVGTATPAIASSTLQPNTASHEATITSQLERPIRSEASKKKLTFKERIAKAVLKRAMKRAERKAKKRGVEAAKATQGVFADVVVLAGAVVTIAGIITIISSPTSGLVIAALGLVVYLLGKASGGSLSNIFR